MFLEYVVGTRNHARFLHTLLFYPGTNSRRFHIYFSFPVAPFVIHYSLPLTRTHFYPVMNAVSLFVKILFLFAVSFSYNFSGQWTAVNYILLLNQQS